jgi:hypothetical protein
MARPVSHNNFAMLISDKDSGDIKNLTFGMLRGEEN